MEKRSIKFNEFNRDIEWSDINMDEPVTKWETFYLFYLNAGFHAKDYWLFDYWLGR